MMDYFENQMLLKSCYDLKAPEISIPGTTTRIVHVGFHSEIKPETKLAETSALKAENYSGLLQRSFDGNYDFTYPVFIPDNKEIADGAIVLLHGLNERNWNKYLYWAQYLSENTGKAVILFPMAFHVNRSPGYWSDPRAMQEVSLYRTEHTPLNAVSTSVNAALSTRLDLHPEWFCTSGLQSCYDLISLTREIRNGGHPLFKAGASVDFFAYSVGAFLLEVLLIANPDKIFSESKSFLFSGGSSFQQMKGISRYIMDAQAFDRLEETFIRQDPKAVMPKLSIERLNDFSQLWSSFMAMLRLDRFQTFRDRSFHKMRDQISAIGLTKDKVIPANSILQTLCGTKNRNKIQMSILDFPYQYSHENPFPIGHEEIRSLVNQSFLQVFGKVVQFLG
ncbi:MAG: DUF6051 family protein [Bacteroidales bacterium]|nr:DUF6051 family protein [Bacteroidales bacterium]